MRRVIRRVAMSSTVTQPASLGGPHRGMAKPAPSLALAEEVTDQAQPPTVLADTLRGLAAKVERLGRDGDLEIDGADGPLCPAWVIPNGRVTNRRTTKVVRNAPDPIYLTHRIFWFLLC